MTDVVFEPAIARLQRLVDATALHIVFPAVVRTHQAILAHLPVLQGSQPMRATNSQQTRPSFAIAEDNKIFAEHPDGNGNILEIGRQTYGMPITPEHLPALCARPGMRQVFQQFLVCVLRWTAAFRLRLHHLLNLHPLRLHCRYD